MKGARLELIRNPKVDAVLALLKQLVARLG